MSILIKNKAVPKKCEECLFYGIDAESGCFLEKCYVIRRAGQDKPSWCPLVPVPPHGRLIDADALRLTHCKECTLYPDKCMENAGEECDWNSIYHIDHLAPTIIEAEEEQE